MSDPAPPAEPAPSTGQPAPSESVVKLETSSGEVKPESSTASSDAAQPAADASNDAAAPVPTDVPKESSKVNFADQPTDATTVPVSASQAAIAASQPTASQSQLAQESTPVEAAEAAKKPKKKKDSEPTVNFSVFLGALLLKHLATHFKRAQCLYLLL